jgi:hypothetical protein
MNILHVDRDFFSSLYMSHVWTGTHRGWDSLTVNYATNLKCLLGHSVLGPELCICGLLCVVAV